MLPALQDAATQFSRPVEAWVGSRSGEGAAIGLANAKQKQEEQELANEPPGAIPYPESGGGGGGGEEEGGGGGGGCSGMNACIASWHNGVVDEKEQGNNGYGCEIWGSWGHGEPLGGEIVGFGHWKCGSQSPPAFEMQIEAYGEGSPEFEGYEVRLGEPGKSHKITEIWSGARAANGSGQFSHSWKCPATGSWYHLWFWGRQMGTHGRTQWSSTGWEEKVGSCVKRGAVDMSPVGQATEPG